MSLFQCQLSTAQQRDTERGRERATLLRVKEECLCFSVSRPLPNRESRGGARVGGRVRERGEREREREVIEG